MIKQIKESIAKAIKENLDYKVYTEEIKQGFNDSCFFISLISKSNKSVATFKYLDIYNIDITFIPKEDNRINETIEKALTELNKIEHILIKEQVFNINISDIQIIDNMLHYIININIPVNEYKEIEPTIKTYQIIKNAINEITNKKVYYLYPNLNNIIDSFYVIEPSNVHTNLIGLSGDNKELEREIVIRYVSTNNFEDIPGLLETTFDTLIGKIKGKNNIISVSYELDVDYSSEQYQEYEVISHEITIYTKERK